MEEEVVVRSGKDELAKEVEELNSITKKSFEDIINEKIDLDSNFKLESLTDEVISKYGIKEEDVKAYELGLKFFEDKDKTLNPLDIVPEDMLDDADKEFISRLNNNEVSEEDANNYLETMRQQYILQALNIYNMINQEKFSEDIKNLGTETTTTDIIKYFFDTSDKVYCFNSDTMQYTFEKDNALHEIRNAGYANSIMMTKMLDLSKDINFLNKLDKQSKPDRYQRHIDNLNYLFSKKLKTDEKTNTTCVDNMTFLIRRTFFRKFKLDINQIDAKHNGAIAKAYVIAMDELAKKCFSSDASFVEIYFYNINVAMLAQTTDYSKLTGSAKLAYEHILEFITNIYNYFYYK